MTNDFYVIDKLYKILADDKDLEERFYSKWGIDLKNFKMKIADPLTHGGYISKAISLSNLPININMKILDIGPEMGLEIYMLSELVGKIVVCDPDMDNLNLIKRIARKYENEKGVNIGEIIEFKPIGINNTPEVLIEEKNRYDSILSKLGHSLPTFYNVSSDLSIDCLENSSFDCVFVHKILTTITRSGECNPYDIFDSAIRTIVNLLKPKGICSWSEPKFVFEQKGVLQKINSIKGLSIRVIEYQPIELPEKYIQLLITKQ